MTLWALTGIARFNEIGRSAYPQYHSVRFATAGCAPLSPNLFGLHNRGMSVERHVYFFGNGRADGSAAMRDILGGKGAGLAEMANLGLPVPPGFTISARLCITYLEQGTFPDELREEVDRHLKQLERATKKKFGDPRNPLLVSVRSGAAVSMPGMMETILNLGLNDETINGLIAGSGNP